MSEKIPPFPNTPETEVRLKDAELVEAPQKLSPKEASKELMTPERLELAHAIRTERRENFQRLRELRAKALLLEHQLQNKTAEANRIQEELSQLSSERADEATVLAERISQLLEEQELLRGEREGLHQLLEDDAAIESIRTKVQEHYGKAEELGNKKFEGELKTVQQVMMRNDAFVVHTIEWNPELRHNANSNVSQATTFEDDLKILLAFEPTISASSVKTGVNEEGKVSGLWSQAGGVLLGKGEIRSASAIDAGTVSRGIKNRWNTEEGQTPEEIDAVVRMRRAAFDERAQAEGIRKVELGGYNELVIDNPEVFGYFKPADVDENGIFWIHNLRTKKELEKMHELHGRGRSYTMELEVFNRNLESYREEMNRVKQVGLPVFVMTPDRRVLECLDITNSGQVIVGRELRPEDVANGRSGVVIEDRKKLGEELLSKQVFRDEKTTQEAKKIVEEL
ncbi:hypothetical protein C4552_04185 [Candidatus Parcubacteria bacterium]|nr:MAG: hypothetical protein C4552_04185 [Candidatus Parcubacteria bacterium]